MFTEFIAAIATGGVAIVGSIVSLIVSKINSKKMKTDIDSIKSVLDDSGGVFYIICPTCGKRIYLRSMDVHVQSEGGQSS